MMENNYCYQRFKQFEKKYLTEAKSLKHFYDWWKCRWEKICGVMTDLEKRGVDRKKVYEKLTAIDWTLWRFSQYDSFESTRMDIVNFEKEISGLEARLEYENKIQELEKEALKVNPEFTEIFKTLSRWLYARKKANVGDEINAQEEDLKEFSEWLQKEKEKAGVTPYRGKGVESMAIFGHLVGKLGELLNPRFLGYPGVTSPHLVWPCAEAIAELLNGYFVNLKVNFNADQVRKKFDSYIPIEKK